MKKLMIALATAATTMLSFGVVSQEEANRETFDETFHGWTGTSFEDLTEGPVSVGDIVGKDDTGDQDGANKFWYSAATETDELGAITNEVAGAGVSRPDAFSTQGNTKSLQIDTTSPLFRTALPNSSGVQPVDIGDGIYLDTLVKFTAADEAFAENLTGGDKIAIEYVEHEAEGDDVGYTNFVVRAGLIGAELGQTNYFAAVPADFNKDAWHRLTVRTIANVGDGNVGFVIYLDGDMTKTLEYSKDVDAGFGELNALAQTFYNSEKHALFPSAIAAGATGGSTISSVAFSGSGFIDDVSFTATKPTFINEAIRVTIAWDEHVTGMEINGTTLTPEQVAAKSWTGEPNEGSVVAIPTFDTGYVAGAPVLPEGATYNYNSENEEMTFGNLAAGMTCTIKSMFPLYSVSDGVTTTQYDKLSDAIAAAQTGGSAVTPKTFALLADCEEMIKFSSGYVILDLAGHSIQGKSNQKSSLIASSTVNLTITNSIPSSGSVKMTLKTGNPKSAMSLEDTSRTAVYCVKFDGTINTGSLDETDGDFAIYSGTFLDVDAEGDPTEFTYKSFVKNDAKVTPLDDNYFQVGESGGGDTPTEIAVPTAIEGLIYNKGEQTGVAAGTGYTLTGNVGTNAASYTAVATLETGYAWVGGSTDPTNIVWRIDMKGVTPTIVLNPTSAQFDPNKTTVGAYVTSVAAYDGEDLLTEDLDYYVSGLNEPVTGAGEFQVLVIQKAWSEGQNYMITNSQYATLTITAGGAYPTYIENITDPTTKAAYEAKYDTWKATYGADTESAYEEAFLLNCSTDTAVVAAEKAAFKFTSISYDATQSKWITTTTTKNTSNADYNGTVVVKQYSDVGCKTESSTGTFFKAFLQ